MKLALGIAIVALVCACEKEEPAGPVQELTLPRTVKKVGERQGKVEDMKMVMTFEPARGNKVTVDVTKKSHEREEVLAVDEHGVATKVKVSYLEDGETQKMGRGEKAKASLIAGKTYVVWREGDLVKVTREDGSEPAGDELRKVIDENRRLGTPDPFDELVASKTWKTGQKVAFTADELSRVNVPRAAANSKGDRDDFTVVELTLRRIDDGIARFDIKLGTKMSSPEGSMHMTVDGIARVATATSQVQEMSGAGSLWGEMGAPFTGTVTMKIVAE